VVRGGQSGVVENDGPFINTSYPLSLKPLGVRVNRPAVFLNIGNHVAVMDILSPGAQVAREPVSDDGHVK
jgi:hypothetical protein